MMIFFVYDVMEASAEDPPAPAVVVRKTRNVGERSFGSCSH